MRENDPIQEDPNTTDQEDPITKSTDSIDKNKLTQQEVRDLNDKKISIKELARQRNELAITAKEEMQNILRTNLQQEVADIGEYKKLKQELTELEVQIAETDSPEKMQALLRHIKTIPRRMEEERIKKQNKGKEENKLLEKSDPRLKELVERFAKICKENEHLIGGGDTKGYIKWFERELKRKPTIAYGKDIIERFEGKNTYDKDGLAPRRKVFEDLERAFKKHEIDSPLKSPFIKQGGLDERKRFLEGIKSAESEIKRVNDSFWSPKAKKKAMSEILMATSLREQQAFTLQIGKINAIESEGFIYMKNTMSVGGITIRKMSDASISAFLSGLVDEGSIKKRLQYITGNNKYPNGIKEAVENEASLYGKEIKPEVAKLFGISKGLEAIYEGNPKGLALAIKSFEKLDFMKKIKALKEHEKLVTKEKTKEGLEKKLTIKAAEVAIDEAARKGEISATTQKKYKEWFRNENNYRDPQTNEPGNPEILKQYYKILTDPTPDGKARNLSAYRIKRDRFKAEVKKLKTINPDIDEKELKKWQEEYDKKGWTDRKKVYKDLKKTQEKLEKKVSQKKKTEKAIGLTKKEKETNDNLDKKETIQAAMTLINEDQPAEALKTLIKYNETNPDDVDIIFWMEVALKRIKEFGSGKKREEKQEKEVEEEINEISKSDESIKDKMEEENLVTLNLEGTRQSENRHERKISGKDRAKKESMTRTQGNKLEQDLTEDFYEKTDDEHILNKEGTGEKITEIKFDGINMTDEEREHLKEQTRKHESQLLDKSGFTHVEKKDKSGKKISTEQAEREQEKRLEELEDKLTDKALKKTEEKSGREDKSVFNLQTRIAARRKAKKLIEEKRHSHESLKS